MTLGLLACTRAERSAAPPPPPRAAHATVTPPAPAPGGAATWNDPGAYDRATFETIRGRVVAVDQVPSPRGAGAGLHLTMSTESGETIAVHLGPTWFVDAQGFALGTGDRLEVGGSRSTVGGEAVLLARTVVKDGRTLVLRDESGVPRWSRARGTAAAAAKTPAATELSDRERRALLEALDEEYRSLATYEQALLDLGGEPPFSSILQAEASHIEALRTLFVHYDLPVPVNPWPARVARFSSIGEACAAGIELENETIALYQRLMGATRREGILAIFGYLQRAAQENHLPAFRRCASRSPRGR